MIKTNGLYAYVSANTSSAVIMRLKEEGYQIVFVASIRGAK